MRRPRLALPFTVLTAPDRVRLVAGEEFRFTVSGPGIERWLPAWLQTLDETTLEGEQRETARRLLERLASERLLDLTPPAPLSASERGEPPEQDGVGGASTRPQKIDALPAPPLRFGEGAGGVRFLPQDRLDFDELTRFNADCLAARVPSLWLTTAPLGRGYVSPVCLPDDGPCLVCLLGHFRRLSPLPELYDELAAHARAGGAIPATPFPASGRTMLEQLAAWKVERYPTAAAFALHVLEAATMEVTSHRVTVDPECPACHGRR